MARRKLHEEHENHERWLVSYADFITLLFAFFVVMYATSNADTEKQKKLEESIKVELRLAGAAGSNGGAKSLEDEVMNLVLPEGTFPRNGSPAEAADYVDRALTKNMDANQKKEKIQEIYHDDVGVRISLAASSFFASSSAKLKGDSLKALDKVGEVLKTNDKKVLIEGHTDDTPISQSQYPSNWELASARAGAVIRYFTKIHQMDPKRFVALYYGDQKPLVPNDTEAHRAQNRRIEIFIVVK